MARTTRHYVMVMQSLESICSSTPDLTLFSVSPDLTITLVIDEMLELHCLELCKVAWNLYITSVEPGSDDLHVKQTTKTYLRWAESLSEKNREGLANARRFIAAEYETLERCLV
jgi:hypothetical protein